MVAILWGHLFIFEGVMFGLSPSYQQKNVTARIHQKFQVPKKFGGLSLMTPAVKWGVGLSISRIHSAYP